MASGHPSSVGGGGNLYNVPGAGGPGNGHLHRSSMVGSGGASSGGLGSASQGASQQSSGSSLAALAGFSRFSELFELLKSEYDNILQESSSFFRQRDEYEHKLQLQMAELGQLQKSIHDLERAHVRMRHHYEVEIAAVKKEFELQTGTPFYMPSSPPGANAGSPVGTNLSQLSVLASSTSSSGTPASSTNLSIPSTLSKPLAPPNLGSGILSSGGAYGPSIASIMQSSSSHFPPSSSSSGAGAQQVLSSPRNSNISDNHNTNGLPGNNAYYPGQMLPSMNSHHNHQNHPPHGGPHPPLKRYRSDDYGIGNPSINGKHSGGMGTSYSAPGQDMTEYKRGSSHTNGSGSHTLGGGASGSGHRSSISGYPSHSSSSSMSPSGSSNDAMSPTGAVSSSGGPRPRDDWLVIYNPKVPKRLNVSLICTIEHGSVVCSVAFSPNAKFLASGSNKAVFVNDTTTGATLCTFKDDLKSDKDLYIRSLCFSPDSRFIATGAEDAKIRIWDISKQSLVQTLIGHEQDIYSLQYSPDGSHIASASGDSTFRVWNSSSGKCLFTIHADDSTSAGEGGITSLAFSPDGRYISTGSLDKSIRIWNAEDGAMLDKLDGHKNSVYSVQFSPDGKSILSGSLDKTIKVWSFDPSGKSVCRSTLTGHKDFVLSVCYSADNQWIVSGSKDRSLQFWDPSTSTSQLMLQGHKNSVISIAMSMANHLFATGSGDSRARIWKYQSMDDIRGSSGSPSGAGSGLHTSDSGNMPIGSEESANARSPMIHGTMMES